MKSTRRQPAGKPHQAKKTSSATDDRILKLEEFLSRSPRVSRALLVHTTLEEHCIGAPEFEDRDATARSGNRAAIERRLVAVERREIDGLRSRYYLRNKQQREQLLRGLLHGFSHRELRISRMSYDEFLKRGDDRDMETAYFVPERGRWRRARASEAARCTGLSDRGRCAFRGFLYTVPRWSQFCPDPKPHLMLGLGSVDLKQVFVFYSKEAREADDRFGIKIFLHPWTLVVSTERNRFTHYLQLDTRATARRVGALLMRALGTKALERVPGVRKVEVPLHILWPSANARDKRFNHASQFVV